MLLAALLLIAPADTINVSAWDMNPVVVVDAGYIVLQRRDPVSGAVAFQGFYTRNMVNEAAFLYTKLGDKCFYGNRKMESTATFTQNEIPCHVFSAIETKFIRVAEKLQSGDLMDIGQ